jgi:hypothetical protein
MLEWKWNLYRATNQEFFQIIYKNTFFPDFAHNQQKQRNISTDTQDEKVNTQETRWYFNSNYWVCLRIDISEGFYTTLKINMTIKPVSISEIFVLRCHLTTVLVREDSAVLQHGWHEVNEACWLVKHNVEVLYMHKSLPWRMLGQMFQTREIHGKLQINECSWKNENEITRNRV